MVAVERLLARCCPACADDADNVFVTLGPDDEDQAAPYWADRDASVFDFGVSFVEDFVAVDVGREELTRLLEGDAVLFLLREILGMVPE